MNLERTIVTLSCTLLLMCSSASGQEVTFSLSDADGLPGFSTDVEVAIETDVDLQGWSFSVCHDPEIVTPIDSEVTADGSWMFQSITTSEDGVQAIFISTIGTDGGAPADEKTVVLEIEYDLIGESGDETEVEFCDTVGDPPVETLAVYDDEAVYPELESGIIILDVSGAFRFTLPSPTVAFAAGSGEQTFRVRPTIREDEENPGFPNDTFGFSLGIAHDPDYLSATSVDPSSVLDDLADGDGPEFFTAALFDDGLTLGVVYTLEDLDMTIAFDEAIEVAEIEYETNGDNLADATEPVLTVLEWSNALGDPTVENTVVVNLDGDTASVAKVNGTVTLIPGGDLFIRGDCNLDGRYNLGDPIALLGHLFRETGPRDCEDACDADDSGDLSLGDAIRMLNNQFGDGANPAPPYPDCGADPEDDDLTCVPGDVCD